MVNIRAKLRLAGVQIILCNIDLRRNYDPMGNRQAKFLKHTRTTPETGNRQRCPHNIPINHYWVHGTDLWC